MTSSLVASLNDRSAKPIDREKNCPLLLRVFLNHLRHHQLSEFARGTVPSNELQIYTWQDATLKELTNLVKEVNQDARRKGTVFEFALVYPDNRKSIYRLREIGVTCCGQYSQDDEKTLAQARFQVGDYLDISITPPQQIMQRDRMLPNRQKNHRY